MAKNMFKKYTESKTREWVVPAGTVSGDLVIHLFSGEVGVALTSRGDATSPAGIPGVTGGTIRTGGVGNRPNCATVAVDGTWLFAVTGADNGDTLVASGGGTPSGTPVYAVATGDKVTSLTLDEGTNDFVGVIDNGVIVNGVAPVKIGVVL